MIGYCAITADILHRGHITFINICKGMCDKLIVGLMTDNCIKEYKGHYPIMTYEERQVVVEALKNVHLVIPQDTFEFPKNLKKKYRVDTIFDSTDHARKGSHIYIPYDQSISSSMIKERILDSCKCRKR